MRDATVVAVRSAMGAVGDRCEQELRALVAAARHGAADPAVIGEVGHRLGDGDGGASVREWTAAGGAAWAAANRCPSASLYLHAASTYAAALALIDMGDGWVDERRLWERQRACWDAAVRLLGGELWGCPGKNCSSSGSVISSGVVMSWTSSPGR